MKLILFLKSFLKRSTHPVFVFVALQGVWLLTIWMWVFWYLESSRPEQEMSTFTEASHFNVFTLVLGCILLGILLLGTVLLFVTSQKQRRLVIQQKSFVSSVTHELRSPLASLQLSCETLKARDLSRETRSALVGMALEDVSRLTQLVDHILVSSRLDRGIRGFVEEGQWQSLLEVFEEVAQQALWLDSELLDRLEIFCSDELLVFAPRPALVLVFSNLLENAVKYSPKGKTIQVIADAREGGATVVVRDQGFGLAAADRKRIFRMFHRAAVSHKKAIPGTGLGLFIVRSVVRELGGRAWVESEGRDRGASFYVSLPQARNGSV